MGKERLGLVLCSDTAEWIGREWKGSDGIGPAWIGSSFRSANDEW
jgi:hypothetical protein